MTLIRHLKHNDFKLSSVTVVEDVESITVIMEENELEKA